LKENLDYELEFAEPPQDKDWMTFLCQHNCCGIINAKEFDKNFDMSYKNNQVSHSNFEITLKEFGVSEECLKKMKDVSSISFWTSLQ